MVINSLKFTSYSQLSLKESNTFNFEEAIVESDGEYLIKKKIHHIGVQGAEGDTFYVVIDNDNNNILNITLGASEQWEINNPDFLPLVNITSITLQGNLKKQICYIAYTEEKIKKG